VIPPIFPADVTGKTLIDIRTICSTALHQALADKEKMFSTPTAQWSYTAFARNLALIQVDESWTRHLTRLDLLKEEMVLNSFTAEKDVMVTYRYMCHTTVYLLSGLSTQYSSCA
tara:strand:- start:2992 stop:3333 length:342 start_codon:yes stop_codon:yes gene_type:complete